QHVGSPWQSRGGGGRTQRPYALSSLHSRLPALLQKRRGGAGAAGRSRRGARACRRSCKNVVAGGGRRGVRDVAVAPDPVGAPAGANTALQPTTQVSLVPPPCEELTTSEPALS